MGASFSTEYVSRRCEGGFAAAAERDFAKLFAGLLALQAVLWIGLPLIFESSVRLDVAEGVIDGPAWQLSYFRHPPLSSWLSGLAWSAGPLRYFVLFTIGFVLASGAYALAAAFIARVDERAGALVTLMAGLASPYATYVALQINHNITQMPFWAATLAALWFALELGGWRRWALVGLAIGGGLWAKYALLHLVAPLALVALFVPAWRRHLATPGPWLALVVAALVIAPHMADALAKHATTVAFALHTTPTPWGARFGAMGIFAANCLLANLPMAVLAWAACGAKPLANSFAIAFDPRRASRLDLYLVSAVIGPPLVVIVAAAFGVGPHYMWLTAFTVPFAAFWGHLATRAGAAETTRRVALCFAVIAGSIVVSYLGVHEIAPRYTNHTPYPDTDGPRLAALAERYWGQFDEQPFSYVVSLGAQHGYQAAGSIAFDTSRRVAVLEEGDPTQAPWLDVAGLERRGALIVSTSPIPADQKLLGRGVTDVQSFARPKARGPERAPIYFGRLPPKP